MEPIRDLIVFDWVLASGSTQAAAELLGLPQSSVSRRYRALANQFSIPVRRQGGELFISGSDHTCRLLRELCQHYRFEHHLYRWSWQPQLRHLLPQAGRVGEGARILNLSEALWQQRQNHLASGILDACFELCSDPAVDWLAPVNLGVHLQIPARHPLLASPPERWFQESRSWPINLGGLPLDDSLSSELEADGFVLIPETERRSRGGQIPLQLQAGPAPAEQAVDLPYQLMAAWRVAHCQDTTRFTPTLLEQAVLPLQIQPRAGL